MNKEKSLNLYKSINAATLYLERKQGKHKEVSVLPFLLIASGFIISFIALLFGR